ncbi:MAG: iron-containing alcohol dehydrogenase [Mycoplasmataceae bacterium]|nr:iron-containing alcohol dehydrogenase [Mycoplasmataceae bacterium]
MAEFQIIPTYIIGNDFVVDLIQKLRIYKIKKIYLILQNINLNNKLLKKFKELCEYYEIIYHEEIIDFLILDEKKFNYYLECIKTGLPEALVSFGGEIAINIAKLFNYLIANKKIKSLNEFTNNLDLNVQFPLKLFCILNEFTLGSENNFPGVLKIKQNEQINRYVFNANSMPSYIFSDNSLFKHLNTEEINLNIYAMIIRSIEQYLYKNNFEWTKNYILSNIQTLIDIVNDKQIDDNDKLANLIWTNLSINNGISNLLNVGDWKIHILAYELGDFFNISLNDAILLLSIRYLEIRSNLNETFKKILNNLGFQLLGNKTNYSIIDFLNEIMNKLLLYDRYVDLNKSLFLNKKEKLLVIKTNVIKKILLIDNSMNESELDELISLILRLN